MVVMDGGNGDGGGGGGGDDDDDDDDGDVGELRLHCSLDQSVCAGVYRCV